jgi:signal transduction histidine kinase/DNA-binding response OmpR family regulator/tetratricopeptide (TPR) repeat protein
LPIVSADTFTENGKGYMKSQCIRILALIVFSFSCVLMNRAYAQIDKKHAPEYISSEWHDELRSLLEARLSLSNASSSHFFFIEKIEDHCQEDLGCQWDSYWIVMDEFNALKKYVECIPLTEKLIELAKLRNDEDGEIASLWKLVRFYVFMEDFEMESMIYGQLLEIFEERGDMDRVLFLKTLIAEDKALKFNRVEEAISEMKELVARATELNLERTKNVLLTRLLIVYEQFGYTEDLPEIIETFEKIPVSDPITTADQMWVCSALSARATLAMAAGDYTKAEAYYNEILALTAMRFEGKGDLWYEIEIKHRLARLEWERGNLARANDYLEETYQGAVEFQMHDHIIDNLKMRIEFSEGAQNYADALKYTRALYAHQAKVDSVSADFDEQRYYTRLENERLEAEKASQALELQLKNNQLVSLAVIGALALLLAAGLFFGFRKQQQRRRELHQQNMLIQEQAEQLKNLDQAKTRFFANVSHELRTPLTLMLGPIKTVLQGDQLTAKQVKLLKMANKSGERLQQLVGEILDLRKLELNKMEVNPQPTSIAAFFSRHLAQFESLAERNAIEFSIDIAIDEQVVADIDREKVRQIIFNLLSNAFKFTPSGGQIKAALSLQEEVLHFSVADTGPGIHPDDLPHVFDRYFQTNRPEKPIEGGTGIGLALCQEYVRLFGGAITVTSEMNEGTTFALSFPVTLVESIPQALAPDLKRPYFPPEERPASTEELIPSCSNQPRPSILVVEDNPDLSDYLKLLLSEKYEVITAENGRRAWDCILPGDGSGPARDFQLILSDLMMPVMDGFQLLEKLKATDATRHIPVVMLTARADVRDKLRALRIGVDDYLIKPFEEEELMVRIANLLEHRAARQTATPERAPAASTPLISNEDQMWLGKFEEFVQQNLSSDLLSVPMLGDAFAMSESTLLRQLKRLTGLSPVQYLKEMRLEKARRLIEDNTYNSIARIAYEIGYGDPDSFSRAFKRRYGKTPSGFITG